MLAQHLPDAIAMIVALSDINESLLAKAPRLKIVRRKHGVGVDNIDLTLPCAKFLSLMFPDAIGAVADFALGLIQYCPPDLSGNRWKRSGQLALVFLPLMYMAKPKNLFGLGHQSKWRDVRRISICE